MKKAIIIIFTACFIVAYLPPLALTQDQMAVTSSGELNVKGNDNGTVIAGSTADLILTVVADMSQMEPGEEIKSIQIIIPPGFSAGDDAVTLVTVGGEEKTDYQLVVDGNRIIITLSSLITYTTMVVIEFTVNTPASPGSPDPFIVGILNDRNNPILYSIDGKDADGISKNNNSLLLTVITAIKPLPPSGISVKRDPSGENDLIVSWTRSEDPEVHGYLIYRLDKGNDPLADIPSREQTSYTDVNLQPGEYSYTVRSYKTKDLKSDTPDSVSAEAVEDTKPPEPARIHPEIKVKDKKAEITWEASPSLDVVNYVVYRGEDIHSLDPISEEIDAADSTQFSYTDEFPPLEGVYLYVVEAIDEVGHKTKSDATDRRLASSEARPYPNPFTPLSADDIYHQVTFPAAIVEGGEGVFAIKIFDLEGDIVIEKEAAEDSEEIKWDGKDSNGEYVNSGVYVYQATRGNQHKVGTVIVAK
jgi:hypothetical protein